jgi:hypothetical protein
MKVIRKISEGVSLQNIVQSRRKTEAGNIKVENGIFCEDDAPEEVWGTGRWWQQRGGNWCVQGRRNYPLQYSRIKQIISGNRWGKWVKGMGLFAFLLADFCSYILLFQRSFKGETS